MCPTSHRVAHMTCQVMCKNIYVSEAMQVKCKVKEEEPSRFKVVIKTGDATFISSAMASLT